MEQAKALTVGRSGRGTLFIVISTSQVVALWPHIGRLNIWIWVEIGFLKMDG